MTRSKIKKSIFMTRKTRVSIDCTLTRQLLSLLVVKDIGEVEGIFGVEGTTQAARQQHLKIYSRSRI